MGGTGNVYNNMIIGFIAMLLLIRFSWDIENA